MDELCPPGVEVVRIGRRRVVVSKPNVRQYGHQADEIVYALAYARLLGLPVVFRRPRVVASEAMFAIESEVVEIEHSRSGLLATGAFAVSEARLALRDWQRAARQDLRAEALQQLREYRRAHPRNPFVKLKIGDLRAGRYAAKGSVAYGRPYWRRRLVADPVPVRLLPEIEHRAAETARRHGIETEAKLVTVHVRERGYKLGGEMLDKGGRRDDSVRNARIENHFAAIDFLAERGYTVVRVGDPSMMPVEHPGLVDLATSPLRDPYVELYCLWRSDFLICGESGPQGAAYLTDTPSLTVNATDPVSSFPVRSDGIYLMKTIVDRLSGAPLSLGELLSMEHLTHLRDASCFAYVENTPEQILEAVVEMLDLLENGTPPSPAQRRYEQLLIEAIEANQELPYVKKWGIDAGFMGRGRLARSQAEAWLGPDGRAQESLRPRMEVSPVPPAAAAAGMIARAVADAKAVAAAPDVETPVPVATERRPGSKRFLFVMQHLGFVRNYEPTLRLLAERGHQVHIAYFEDRADKGESVFGEQLVRLCPGVTIGPAPTLARGRWPTFARRVRLFTDYLRYFDSRFAEASVVRARAVGHMPGAPHKLFELLGDRGVRRLIDSLRRIELAVPTNPSALSFIAEQRPDIVLVTPLVDFASPQVDFVKAARALGIPSGACIASWDNLTNKGHMRVVPDRVFVWNDVQRQEAVEYHGIPPERISVTGAQLFDHWFGRAPERTREEFCRAAGLDPARPFVIFLGSTHGVAPAEVYFVERWIRSIRGAGDPRLAGLGVLVRPHPASAGRYLSLDVSQFDNVSVWPPRATQRSDYYSEAGKNDFFESLYYSAAAVGLNTSALIEAAIVGRTVATVRVDGTAVAQDGTLHFAYLANERDGLLRIADSMETHLSDLARILDGAVDEERISAFVRHFVRPRGLGEPAAPILANELEAATGLEVAPRAETSLDRLLRLLLVPLFASMLFFSTGTARLPAPRWVRLLRPLIWAWVRLVAVGMWLHHSHWPGAARRAHRLLRKRATPVARRLRRATRHGRHAARRGLRVARRSARRGARAMRASARAAYRPGRARNGAETTAKPAERPELL